MSCGDPNFCDFRSCEFWEKGAEKFKFPVETEKPIPLEVITEEVEITAPKPDEAPKTITITIYPDRQ